MKALQRRHEPLQKGAGMGKRRLAKARPKSRAEAKGSKWIIWGGLALAVVLVGGILTYAFIQAMPPKVETGKPAPNFTLHLLNGKDLQLSGFRGRPVFLNFWAST